MTLTLPVASVAEEAPAVDRWASLCCFPPGPVVVARHRIFPYFFPFLLIVSAAWQARVYSPKFKDKL